MSLFTDYFWKDSTLENCFKSSYNLKVYVAFQSAPKKDELFKKS